MLLIKPARAAEVLCIPRSTLRMRAFDQALKPIRTGGGHRRYDLELVEELAADRAKLDALIETTRIGWRA